MSAFADAKGLVRQAVDSATVRFGLGHSEERLAHDAQSYWSGAVHEPGWRDNSHFRDAEVFEEVDWSAVGTDHWELFSRLAWTAVPSAPLDRIVECARAAQLTKRFGFDGVERFRIDVEPALLREAKRNDGQRVVMTRHTRPLGHKCRCGFLQNRQRAHDRFPRRGGRLACR